MLPKLTSLLLCLASMRLLAQNDAIFKPDSIRKEIQAVQIHGNLRVDGVLNEPQWKLAKPSPRFTEIEPVQGAVPAFETYVKVLYNRQYLYFGIFSRDSLGKKAIRAVDFKRDFDFQRHDLVNISIDGFNDKRNAMCFATNAYGVQRDYLSFDDLYYDIDWDGLWKVRTSRTDSGWYAEIAIPWQTLRYPKSTDSVQSWGLNVYRNRRLTNEITALSPFPRVFSASRMSYAGLLTNLRPPPPKPNVRIEPYMLNSFDQYKNFDSSVKPNQSDTKVGGDLKWAINTNAVLDATVNTDFAQADADLEVNNITRFSVFFPEKRQFFLENASLFSPAVQMASDQSGGSMHLQPFFSRTIGLDTTGNPIPIVAGARFVNRSDKINYGALVMRQKAADNNPATNFFVGRYSQNFGQENRVGGLFTVKNTNVGSNIESTIDGFLRLSDAQSVNGIFTQSVTTNNHTQGFAGMVQYFNSTDHYKIWLTQSVVTKNFDPEMGFVSRSDVIGTTPGMNWYYRGKLLPFKKILRAFEPGFLPEFYWQASTGKFIEQTLYFFPLWLNFQSGAYLGYGLIPSHQVITSPFVPLNITIPVGNYDFFQNDIWYSTDPSKFLSLGGEYKWGGYFNGRLIYADWKLQFAPIPHISISAELNRNHFINVGENKTSETVDLYVIQGRLALNPRVQLTGFYQKNSLDNSDSYYVRFSWEYHPLSYIYLIFNHAGSYNLQQLKQTEDHEIFKVSYLKQF
jgi:Domain of unknown function (DUF5916)/Carbohydrate family 9 binding domain-like